VLLNKEEDKTIFEFNPSMLTLVKQSLCLTGFNSLFLL